MEQLEYYKKRLKELANEPTSEEGGMEADDLIYNILIELGYKEIAEDFINVGKWYA